MSDTFVKHGSAPGAAAAEAAYLRWLREGSTAVVEVLDLDEDANTLTIEKVDSARPTVGAAREAGRELAAIHAMGAAAFGAPADGWDGPNFIGTRQQACEPTERWAEFYVHQRVLPFAEKALRAGNLGGGGMDVVKQACDALLEEDEDAPLARIHGDLWAGNLLFGADGPAVHRPGGARRAPADRHRHARAVRRAALQRDRGRVSGCRRRAGPRLAAAHRGAPTAPAGGARVDARPVLRLRARARGGGDPARGGQ